MWSKLDDLNWHTLSPNCERETGEDTALNIERGGVKVEASHARARPAGTLSLCGLDRQLDRQECDLSQPVARLSEALDAVQLAAKNTAEVIWSTQVSPEWHPAEVPPGTTEAQFAYAGGSGLKLTCFETDEAHVLLCHRRPVGFTPAPAISKDVSPTRNAKSRPAKGPALRRR